MRGDNGISTMLTEENVRAVAGPSRAEQEEALLARMQTISELLGKVDAALDTASSAPPGTGQSQRPTSQRGQSALPASAAAPGTAVPSTAGSVRSTTSSRRGYVPEAPELLTIVHENDPAPAAEKPIQFVTYTGQQTLSFSSRRRIDARAAKSDIGSMLGWDAPSSPNKK